MSAVGRLGLFGAAVLAACGSPSPSEAILLLHADDSWPRVLDAGLAAWLGYVCGDTVSVLALRIGAARLLPARLRARLERSALRNVGFKTALVSRVLPASGAVNVAVAAGALSLRRFVVASLLGELAYVAAVIAAGRGAVHALPVQAIALVAVAAPTAAVAVHLIRRHRSPEVPDAPVLAPFRPTWQAPGRTRPRSRVDRAPSARVPPNADAAGCRRADETPCVNPCWRGVG